MASCKVHDRIGPYFDGEVSAQERHEIDQHLLDCADCQRELTGIQNLSRRLAGASVPQLSMGFVGRVGAKAKAQRDMGLLRTAYSLLAVAASLFLAVALWTEQSGMIVSDQGTQESWESVAKNPTAAASGTLYPEVVLADYVVDGLSASDGQ